MSTSERLDLPGARRIALVTGASRGIGREVALQIGEHGYHVLLGVRDPAQGSRVAMELRSRGIDARSIRLDVTDDKSVLSAARQVANGCDHLDALINNAGILLEADFAKRARGEADFLLPPSAVTSQILRRTFDTNFFGAVRVTNALLPLLRRSSAGRIVNVTSRLASLAQAADPASQHLVLLAYNASKAALNSATVHYAREFRGQPLKINAVDPGHCATDINGHFGDRAPAEAAKVITRFAMLGQDGPSGEFHGEQGAIPW